MIRPHSTTLPTPSPALHLVLPTPRPACAETVALLEQLLKAASGGRVRGLAFVASMTGQTYFVDICGDFRYAPTYARGAVAALDDELRELVKGDAK